MIGTIRAIFFDADGTLYDSNRLHYLSYKMTVKNLYGFDLKWAVFRDEVLRTTKSGIDVLRRLGVDVNEEEFYRSKDKLYVDLVKRRLKPMPGALNFLKWCKDKKIRCFVVSDGKLAPLKVALKALSMDSYFERIVTMENDDELRKPNAHGYKTALMLANLHASQVIAVEDTAAGIAAAKSAGLPCIGIAHSINDRKALGRADTSIKNYGELINLLDMVKGDPSHGEMIPGS